MKYTIWFVIGTLFNTLNLHAASLETAQFATKDGVVLKGVWTLPANPLKGVALILPGSGNVDRDGEVSGPFLGNPYQAPSAKLSVQLAETLASSGIASLRYDKRGVGDASQLSKQIVSVLANDAQIATQYIRSRFPDQRLAVVGLSEGAMLAVLLARTTRVDALFLMSMPMRSIDDTFEYQFSQWPLSILGRRLPQASSGEIALAEFSTRNLVALPFGNLLPALHKPLEAFDLDRNGALSLEKELKPAYAEALVQVHGMLNGPDFANWYNDLKSIPAIRDVISGVDSPVTYVYQGLEDAQTDPAALQEAFRSFPGRSVLRTYPGLGHCFSPMLGAIGEVKTSGPIGQSVLGDLGRDIQTAF